jgi:hypothetical protein
MLTAVPRKPDEGRQIAVYSTTNAEIMYIVPPGKTFEGYASSRTGTGGGLSINGAQIAMDVYSSGSQSTPFPLILLAGSIIRCVSSCGTSLWGIET